MGNIRDEYREVLESWNDHTLPYDEQLEKGVDKLLAINKRRMPEKKVITCEFAPMPKETKRKRRQIKVPVMVDVLI